MKGIATASKEWRHKAAGGVAFLLISTLVLTPANGEESTAQRRDRHAPIERLGHDYVYEITADLTPPETQEQLLNRSDLSESTRDGIERMNADGFTLLESIDGEKDFQAIVVEDAEGQKYIAFRGTELKSGWDVADDFGRIGIWQYDNNKARLDQLAAKYKDAIVTGHSLGVGAESSEGHDNHRSTVLRDQAASYVISGQDTGAQRRLLSCRLGYRRHQHSSDNSPHRVLMKVCHIGDAQHVAQIGQCAQRSRRILKLD